jgi:nitric oxide reductase NorD protein
MLSATAHTAAQPLARWLRLLWDGAPPLHLDSAQPYITQGAIHLPHTPAWLSLRAAAAHAAAHLVYSPPQFDGAGLGPLARQLLALLEDARVEALAMRELPGLARLWRPLHTASPADALSAEGLLRRLARALADPAYDDPHPWVDKGRRLFWLHEGMALLALRTPAELRSAALRLGHDLGQMRLTLNTRAETLLPAYRDDHRWMWAADALPLLASSAQPRPSEAMAEPQGQATDTLPLADEPVWHPEWDRLIQRLRPRWAGVIEQALPAPLASAGHWAAPAPRGLQRRLQAALRPLMQGPAGWQRAALGERLDVDALVAWRVLRLAGHGAPTRLYQARRRRPGAAVCVLVDQSASAAEAWGPAGDSLWRAAGQVATLAAQALRRVGLPCTVACFSSAGRRAVHWRPVKPWHEAPGAGMAARLAALQPQGSTRLGAALRHAQAQCSRLAAGQRWVLLLSDGQPHDVDVHDPHYLVEDARQAVRAARRGGVRVACIRLAGPAHAEADEARARHIFGPRGTRTLPQLGALPRVLQALMR